MRTYPTNHSIASSQTLFDFEAAAAKLSNALKQRGLSEDQGLRGELRGSIHQVEAGLNQLTTDINHKISNTLATNKKQGIIVSGVITVIISLILPWQTNRIINRLHNVDLDGQDKLSKFTDSINEFIDTTADIVREIKLKGETV